MDTFKKLLPFILKWEGGYVNNPDDTGGATNKGITQGTYDKWRKLHQLPVKNVKEILDAEVEGIYFNHYYKPSGASNTLSKGLALLLFDTAVNMGVKRAILLCKLANYDIKKMCQLREDLYRRFARQPRQGQFLKGWLNRLNDIKTHALALK